METNHPSSAQVILALSGISKTYPGGTQALIDIHLEVHAHEILCLLGPSGCGKTTLLRVVAGLEQPERGQILFQGRDLAPVPTHRRGFGFMFQDFALFPHQTVAENIAFGLRMANLPRQAQAARVAEMLELVNLVGYDKRSIFELSGGERQRVALARSLAPQPALIMLDEPLGSLDRALREELVGELRTILKQLEVTALYVTHDQDEAMALGDRMVIMQAGRIEQLGAPHQVYTHPSTLFVARFLGLTNLIPATPAPSGVMTPLGEFPLTAPEMPKELTLLLRPEAARLAPPMPPRNPGFSAWDQHSETVVLQGRLLVCTYHGNSYHLTIGIDDDKTLRFLLPAYQRSGQGDSLHPIELPPVGDPIQLLIFAHQATLLPYPVASSSV